VSAADADALREEMLGRWERAAPGWERRADETRRFGMPVSAWMVEHVALQPGERVLELAAGPGDTGFLAAELVLPGGALISSDASEPMLEIARRRAAAQGIKNVEFKRLELEWIDLPAASVDAVLCRWGVMLTVDPATALREMRRVLRPGGRAALAVWNDGSHNDWATTPGRALVTLGFAEPPDPSAPGMFTLAAPGRLGELLEAAGFTEVIVESVSLERSAPSLEDYIADQADLSVGFAEVFRELSEGDRARVRDEIAALAAPFVSADGWVRFPANSLVALANA
jgi:ubiquinone/menaquinone biosynthesis C-methylase UbiE